LSWEADASQILNVNHDFLVATHIREQLDALDDQLKMLRHLDSEEAEPEDVQPFDGHFYLGAKQRCISFELLEKENTSNHFARFRTRLSTFLTALLGLSSAIQFSPHDMVCPSSLHIRYILIGHSR
jgi:hypothetical protein